MLGRGGGIVFCVLVRGRDGPRFDFGAVGRRSCCIDRCRGIWTARCGVPWTHIYPLLFEHINSKTLTRCEEQQAYATRINTQMARRIVVTLLLTAGAALQQPNIQPRALSPQKAVSCAEADALMAQAKLLRTQVEIEERQLRALRAEAKPQAVEGKNNILPLERLKAW